MTDSIQAGSADPLGATLVDGGVNFSVYANHGRGDRAAAVRPRRRRPPTRVIRLDPAHHRTTTTGTPSSPASSPARSMPIAPSARTRPSTD